MSSLNTGYLGTVGALVRANLKRFFRDRAFIFFFFALPVIFLLIFGMMHGNDSFSGLEVAVFDEAESELSETVTDVLVESEIANLAEVDDRGEAEEMMTRGELHAIVVFPANFGELGEDGLPSGVVEVFYSRNNEQAGQMLVSVLEGVVGELDRVITGTRPILAVRSEVMTHEGLSNFDYVFAGLLGYTVLTIGLMTMSSAISGDKKAGATRRLRATVLSKSQLILSYSVTFLVMGALIFALMIGLGIVIFDFSMRGSWLNFGVFTLISTLMMLGFGLLIGGWAKNNTQAEAAASVLMFPMMFLSGVFFPLFLMPDAVQRVAAFIPLTPVVEGIRLIITENFSLLGVMPQLLVIGAWGVVVYVVAIRVFRWE
ncbi:ABC transporter permease [Candidatus Saccharibacteria bacterium]|nr:ABC transporter permease [Candidatus Saccharibacteria bacterium]